MASLTVTFKDHSGELTRARFPIPDTPGTDLFQTALDEISGLESALAGIYLGTLVSISYSESPVENPDDFPASGEAQREKGLRLFYRDDVNGKKYNVTIGTADFGTLAQQGTDLVPLDHAEVAPLVTWMETEMLSVDGNSITVDRAVLVGRSS